MALSRERLPIDPVVPPPEEELAQLVPCISQWRDAEINIQCNRICNHLVEVTGRDLMYLAKKVGCRAQHPLLQTRHLLVLSVLQFVSY